MGLFDKLKNAGKNVTQNVNAGGQQQQQQPFDGAQPSAPLEESMQRYRFQRGLNLGSWFTTEDWLSTQLYTQAADPKKSDFDLARANDAKALMEHHWDTWVTDDDWGWIQQRGFNAVRLPVSGEGGDTECHRLLRVVVSDLCVCWKQLAEAAGAHAVPISRSSRQGTVPLGITAETPLHTPLHPMLRDKVQHVQLSSQADTRSGTTTWRARVRTR